MLSLSSVVSLFLVTSTASVPLVCISAKLACCLILTFISARVYEPYFPSHPERNAYITLLQKKDPPASDALLKSALVRRAIADVQRLLRIREDKPALQNLLQKGSIGDDLWNSLLSAEKELEAEIVEVVSEANSFAHGWGQVIFPTANEMLANEKIRAIYERTAETRAELGMKSHILLQLLPIDNLFRNKI